MKSTDRDSDVFQPGIFFVLSFCSFTVPTWVFSSYFGFLPQSKSMYLRLTGNSKLTLGVIVKMHSLCLCVGCVDWHPTQQSHSLLTNRKKPPTTLNRITQTTENETLIQFVQFTNIYTFVHFLLLQPIITLIINIYFMFGFQCRYSEKVLREMLSSKSTLSTKAPRCQNAIYKIFRYFVILRSKAAVGVY